MRRLADASGGGDVPWRRDFPPAAAAASSPTSTLHGVRWTAGFLLGLAAWAGLGCGGDVGGAPDAAWVGVVDGGLVLGPPGFDMDGVDHTVVVLPDTQNYVRPEFNPLGEGLARLEEQVDFIVTQHAGLRTALVVHEGDLTQWNSPEEWAEVDRILGRLDGVVPYLLVPGNHDLGPNGYAETRESALDVVFPPARFAGTPWFGGVFEPGKLQNSWLDVSAGTRRYLVLGLEFGARDGVLTWAEDLLRAHPQHTALVVTHGFLDEHGDHLTRTRLYSPCSYSFAAMDAETCNDPDRILGRLGVFPNVQMVLSGHAFGQSARVDVGAAGTPVFQLMANYQHLPRGGDGFLRVLMVMSNGRTVRVVTYSPTRGEFSTRGADTFTLDLLAGVVLQQGPP